MELGSLEKSPVGDNLESSFAITERGKPTIDDRVKARQLQISYRLSFRIWLAALSAAALLVLVMWNQIAHSTLLIWLGVYALIGISPFPIVGWAYARASHVDRHARIWWRCSAITGFLHGSTWGSAGYLFFLDGDLGYQMILFAAMAAPAAMIMATALTVKPAFYANVLPMLLPLTLLLAMEGDRLHVMLAASMIVYLAGLVFVFPHLHKAFLNSIRLGFENLDLVAELTRKKNEAERANMAKTRFLAAASHDLRQPLHAQVLFLAELRARLHDPESIDVVEYLESSTNSLRDMLNTMLDVSRLDAGVVKPALTVFHVSMLFDRLRFEFEPMMREKGLHFYVAQTGHCTHTDSALMEIILRNLLSNALRYTSQGEVTLSCRQNENSLTIEVRDSGIGIPAEHLDSIFEEFYQLGNPERDRENGLGLGLSIVGRLAKLLGHPVRVASRLGSGTTVSLDVPRHALNVDLPTKRQVTEVHPAMIENTVVLVIDDDALVRKGMTGLLKRWGCTSLAVASAEEAVAQMKTGNFLPTVIVADYRLRGDATGAEAIARVQEFLGHAVPAIIITGDTSPERLRQATDSGYPLLHKPIDPPRLYQLMQNLTVDRIATKG